MLPCRRLGAVLCAVIISVLCLPPARAAHRAHLSLDLLARESARTADRGRVILHTNGADVAAVAARHHLEILNVLEDGAVVSASAGELSALAGDDDVSTLSGDLPVRTWMSVSNASTAADQTRTGSPGLLGIGGIPGVTGQGIGVAVIDSGVNPHPALGNRIVANVSKVTGDPSYLDAFGHGTHVAGIIAGSAAAAYGITSLY